MGWGWTETFNYLKNAMAVDIVGFACAEPTGFQPLCFTFESSVLYFIFQQRFRPENRAAEYIILL